MQIDDKVIKCTTPSFRGLLEEIPVERKHDIEECEMTGTINCKGGIPSEFLAHLRTVGVDGSLEEIFREDPSSVEIELLLFFNTMLDERTSIHDFSAPQGNGGFGK